MLEPRSPGNAARDWLLWPALGVALSPILFDRAGWILADGHPYYGSIAAIPFLIGVLTWRERGRARAPTHRASGGALIAFGLACQALGLLSRTAGLATLAIPAGVVGLACFLGRPRIAVALLSLWMVPIPDALLEWATPGPEAHVLGWAAAPWLALGAPLELAGPVAHCGGGRLELSGYDVGAPLAFFGAGLGLFLALARDFEPARCLAAMAIGAVLLAAVQPIAVSLAVGGLCLGLGDAARTILGTGPWLLATIAAVSVVLRPPDVLQRPAERA